MNESKWEVLALNYLANLGDAEYDAHLDSKGKSDTYHASEYHRELIGFLSVPDEYSYKELRARRGIDSALGF